MANLALMRAFRRSPLDFLDRLKACGADRAPVRVGTERVLLVDDADQVWALLTTHARRTSKGRGMARARLLLGDGLLTSEGEPHLRHRRALQPAFTASQVAGYRTDFAAAARRVAERWTDGGKIELVAAMSTVTLDAVGSALFDSDLSEPAPRITAAMTELLRGFRLAMLPGGRRLLASPLPAAARVRAARTDLESVVRDLVRGRWSGGRTPGPLPGLLGPQPDRTGRLVRDEAVTLLVAGHETTAMALVWALAAIDQDPAVRADLESEWDADAASDPNDDRTDRRPLTTAVLAEALRLRPPSWLFTRRVLEPLALGGRTVPTGTMCLVSPALLHRDPRWWPDPDRFRPERWLRSDPVGRTRFDARAPGQPRGAYLPFGAGPRMCIGEQFAWTEAATVLAELGRTWRLHLLDEPPEPGPSSMTLRPHGTVRAQTSRRRT